MYLKQIRLGNNTLDCIYIAIPDNIMLTKQNNTNTEEEFNYKDYIISCEDFCTFLSSQMWVKCDRGWKKDEFNVEQSYIDSFEVWEGYVEAQSLEDAQEICANPSEDVEDCYNLYKGGSRAFYPLKNVKNSQELKYEKYLTAIREKIMDWKRNWISTANRDMDEYKDIVDFFLGRNGLVLSSTIEDADSLEKIYICMCAYEEKYRTDLYVLERKLEEREVENLEARS